MDPIAWSTLLIGFVGAAAALGAIPRSRARLPLVLGGSLALVIAGVLLFVAMDDEKPGPDASSDPTSTSSASTTARGNPKAGPAETADGRAGAAQQHLVTELSLAVGGTAPPPTVCPYAAGFDGAIAMSGGPVTVRYSVVWSDGTSDDEVELKFTGAGSRAVKASHRFASSGEHWGQLRILSPERKDSSRATFALQCITGNSVSVEGIEPSAYTGSCAEAISIRVDLKIISASAGKVFYTAEREGSTPFVLDYTFSGPSSLDANTWLRLPAGTTDGSYQFRAKATFPNGEVLYSPQRTVVVHCQ